MAGVDAAYGDSADMPTPASSNEWFEKFAPLFLNVVVL